MGGVAGILRMLLLLLRMLLLMKELFRTCVCSCCVSECACLRCFPFFSSLALALPAPCRVVFSVPCHLARTEHDRIQENKTRQTQKHASQRHDTQRNDTQRDTMRSEIGKTDATEIFSFFRSCSAVASSRCQPEKGYYLYTITTHPKYHIY